MINSIKENFTGRICTILTQPVSFPFKDALQHSYFFTGKVELVDDHGIWLRHVHSNTVAFYCFPIVGIVEEQVIPQNDPRADKIKEELKKKESPVSRNGQFIPVDELTKMVRKV